MGAKLKTGFAPTTLFMINGGKPGDLFSFHFKLHSLSLLEISFVCHPEQSLLLREDLILYPFKNWILTSVGKPPASSE